MKKTSITSRKKTKTATAKKAATQKISPEMMKKLENLEKRLAEANKVVTETLAKVEKLKKNHLHEIAKLNTKIDSLQACEANSLRINHILRRENESLKINTSRLEKLIY